MTGSMSLEQLEQRLERERRARHEAERLLEEKSSALFLANWELQEAGAQLRESGLRLKAIIDAVALSVFTIDDDGVIQSVNASASQMFGYGEDELIGTLVWELLPRVLGEAGGKAALDSENLLQLDGIPAEIAVRKDGSVFPADYSISDTVVNEERIVVVAIRDISKRVAREQDRRALEAQLMHAQKLESLGTLAGGIAHEINTPTQYIGDNLRFLAESFEDLRPVFDSYARLYAVAASAAERSACVEAVGRALEEADLDYLLEEMPNAVTQSLEGVKQVASIVLAMKEFSHPGAKAKDDVDLNRAVENALAVSRNAWKHIASLESDLDPALGPVPCVAAEINQVLLNLIVNAAHAIEGAAADGRQGLLRVSSRRRDDSVEIEVADNGGGIAEEAQARVFDPFFTTKDVGKGTGQGLSISRDIVVNKHGGELTFETVVGQGTRFFVRLPLAGGGASEAADEDLEAVA